MVEYDIGSLDDFPEGKPVSWERDGIALVIINRGGLIYALEDVCSHMEVPLSLGEMVDEFVIQCSAHGARFDIRDGRNLCLPAVHPVRAYRTAIRENRVFVIID